MINKELIGKFKGLYQEQFNISLSDEEATKMATDLLNLMRVLLKPDPKPNNEEENQEERKPNEAFRTE